MVRCRKFAEHGADLGVAKPADQRTLIIDMLTLGQRLGISRVNTMATQGGLRE
jgi:hypothetical protein